MSKDAGDDVIERIRKLTRQHAGKLVLVEDLEPDVELNDVLRILDLEPKRSKAFAKYHHDDWARWHKPKPAVEASALAGLPPSYARFVAEYGSLTWLSRPDAYDDGRWVGNVGDNGWGLITLLNQPRAKYLTELFRDYDLDADELREYGFDRVIAFAGFANDAWAFDQRRRNDAGDFAITALDEDQIFADIPHESKIEPKEKIASFTEWLSARVDTIAAALK